MEAISFAIMGAMLSAYCGVKVWLDRRNRKFTNSVGHQTHDPARWRNRRLLQPAQPIAAAQPGLARLSGVSKHKQLLSAPFSGRPVLGYALSLTALNNDHSRMELFPTMAFLADFYLADDSGTALVKGEDARLLFHYFEPPLELGLPPETLNRALAAEGYNLSDYLDRTQIQVFEQVLLDNTEMAVSGEASLEVDPAGALGGLRHAPQLLVVRSSKKHPLLVASCSQQELRASPPLVDLLPIARRP